LFTFQIQENIKAKFPWSCFGRTYTKIWTIHLQIRLAWPLRKYETQNREKWKTRAISQNWSALNAKTLVYFFTVSGCKAWSRKCLYFQDCQLFMSDFVFVFEWMLEQTESKLRKNKKCDHCTPIPRHPNSFVSL